MKNKIREFIRTNLFAWGLLGVVLMGRHFNLMFNNNTLDDGFARIYFVSSGAFGIYAIIYAIHSFRNTKSKNPFREPSFEEDERELLIEYKSRKTAHYILWNFSLLLIPLIGLWGNRDYISINLLLISITALFTINQLIEVIVWIREYRK